MIKLNTAQWKLVAYITIALRVIVPLLIWIQPFWITIVAMVLDIFDNPITLNAHITTHKTYQYMDKILDTYTLGIYWIFSVSWNIPLLSILFAWRLLGVIIIEITKRRKLFVVFPNVFEQVFQVIAFGMYVDPNLMPFINQNLGAIFLVILIIKEITEFRIHYFPQKDSTWIKFNIIHRNY